MNIFRRIMRILTGAQASTPLAVVADTAAGAQDAAAVWQAAKEAHFKQDYAREFHLIQPLAEQGNARAQFNLGVHYQNGLGMAQDYAKAREWYEKAAAQGEAWAQYSLGLLYEKARGVAQDYGKAREWYEKAAAQDDAWAQFNLGRLYAKGRGVTRDDARAREWLEKAAQGDDADVAAHARKYLQRLER